MWARIRETLADWYILIFAICLIAGGMCAASHQAAAPTTTQQSTTQTPTAPSPTSVAMSQQPQRSPAATPPAPSQPSARQTPTTPAGSPAAPVAAPKQTPPPASHDHDTQTMAANAPPPSTKSEQAPVATAAAATAGGGDAAAGRLVYRKCQACHSMDAGKNLLGPSLAGIMGRKAGIESLTWPQAPNRHRLPSQPISRHRAQPRRTPRRPRANRRRKARPERALPTYPTRNSHCGRGSPKAAWSTSASAERSRTRSIRS